MSLLSKVFGAKKKAVYTLGEAEDLRSVEEKVGDALHFSGEALTSTSIRGALMAVVDSAKDLRVSPAELRGMLENCITWQMR